MCFVWEEFNHFPSTNPLSKIFNCNSVKVSYSCMQNMRSIINKHNSYILHKSRSNTEVTTCNCRNKETCPLPGNCLATNVIYKAEVTTTNDMSKKHYIGMTAGPFKLRYNNHMKSFRDPEHAKDTVLSNYIWKLKNDAHQFSVKWSIFKTRKYV